MKHRGSFPFRMDAPGRHNRQTDRQTNGRRTRLLVRLCLRWSLTQTAILSPSLMWPCSFSF